MTDYLGCASVCVCVPVKYNTTAVLICIYCYVLCCEVVVFVVVWLPCSESCCCYMLVGRLKRLCVCVCVFYQSRERDIRLMVVWSGVGCVCVIWQLGSRSVGRPNTYYSSVHPHSIFRTGLWWVGV